METSLTMIMVQGKIFVGKEIQGIKDTLSDCIECLPMLSPDGRYMIIGNVIGTMTIPKDVLIFTLSKNSMYYKNYFQTVSSIEVVTPAPNFGSGPRRVN